LHQQVLKKSIGFGFGGCCGSLGSHNCIGWKKLNIKGMGLGMSLVMVKLKEFCSLFKRFCPYVMIDF